MRRYRRLMLLLGAFVALLSLSVISRFFGGFFGEESVQEEGRPVAGTVLSADGSPAPSHTRVAAFAEFAGDRPIAETGTGEGGTFRFDAVPESADRFVATAGPLEGSAKLGGDASENPSLEIRLSATLDIAGRVLDAESGDAVQGAEVRAGGMQALTDDGGRFRIRGVPVPDGALPSVEIVSPDHAPLTIEPGPDAAWDDLFFKLVRK